ncbi:MAG TPA: hypothetical protein VK522_20035 [Pseudolabrys sp.]|nr:hypothetical protein [Pseudolabrys sp.]
MSGLEAAGTQRRPIVGCAIASAAARNILNVNLMAHNNREHILMYTKPILKRSDNNVFETGYAGSIGGGRSDDRKRGTRRLLR